MILSENSTVLGNFKWYSMKPLIRHTHSPSSVWFKPQLADASLCSNLNSENLNFTKKSYLKARGFFHALMTAQEDVGQWLTFCKKISKSLLSSGALLKLFKRSEDIRYHLSKMFPFTFKEDLRDLLSIQ